MENKISDVLQRVPTKRRLDLVVSRTRNASNISYESTGSAYFDVAATLVFADSDRV